MGGFAQSSRWRLYFSKAQMYKDRNLLRIFAARMKFSDRDIATPYLCLWSIFFYLLYRSDLESVYSLINIRTKGCDSDSDLHLDDGVTHLALSAQVSLESQILFSLPGRHRKPPEV